MSKFKLTEVKDSSQWDEFASNSLQYNIFYNSQYLLSVGRNVKLFFVMKGQQIKAGLSLILSEDGKSCELDDLVIYNGILFENNIGQKVARAQVEQFEITEFVINELDEKFKNIEMALSPQFEDMRPFLWHCYHSEDAGKKYQVDLRYTSNLNISDFFLKKDDEDTGIYQRLDNIRQSDLRKSKENELLVEESKDVDAFISLYKKMMESQNVQIESETFKRMKSLIQELIEKNLAVMHLTNNKNGQLTYMTVFTHHLNKGVYLFGVGDPDSMERFDGTYCIWNAMKHLSSLGVNEIDFEGINSPNRGLFKMSFGGNIKSYYQVYKKN